jgi:hypothetical protein
LLLRSACRKLTPGCMMALGAAAASLSAEPLAAADPASPSALALPAPTGVLSPLLPPPPPPGLPLATAAKAAAEGLLPLPLLCARWSLLHCSCSNVGFAMGSSGFGRFVGMAKGGCGKRHLEMLHCPRTHSLQAGAAAAGSSEQRAQGLPWGGRRTTLARQHAQRHACALATRRLQR